MATLIAVLLVLLYPLRTASVQVPVASSTASVALSTGAFEPEPKPAPKRATGGLNPALKPVCACESSREHSPYAEPRHFDTDGNVLRGEINPNDIGMCQINTEPRNGHVAAAAKLGLDIWSESGNIAYANYLFEKQGYTPWNWSKHCWGEAVGQPVEK